ncbi:MAG: hypothetical protein ACRC6B_09415 [Fusobacteriaceae bacterium]
MTESEKQQRFELNKKIFKFGFLAFGLMIVTVIGLLVFTDNGFETKVLDKQIIPRMKYAVDLEISLNDGVFPDEKILKEIAYKEKQKNPGYENYFVGFYLPGMKLGSGAFAVSNSVSNSNPNMDANINLFMLFDHPKYSERIKESAEGNYYLENYPSSKK